MRCPKCDADVEPNALACPKCGAFTPRGRRTGKQLSNQDAQAERLEDALGKVGIQRDYMGRFAAKWYHILIVALLLLPVVGYGSYRLSIWYILTTAASGASLEGQVLALVKDAPSNIEGKSIGDVVEEITDDKLERQEIKEVEPWNCLPQPNSGWVVRYAFEGKDKFIEARWSVDVQSGKVIPLTDWAKELTGPTKP